MGHKCFISYKKEDKEYRKAVIDLLGQENYIDKSLDRVIDSENGDYIMQVIREDYLCDSTVTIFIIGLHSSENEGTDIYGRDKNYFIKRELQASLFNGKGNTRNGILGIVLPEMYDYVYKGTYKCSTCGGNHNHVAVNDGTVIREFSVNYYCEPHSGCAWKEEDRYCVLVKWDDFKKSPSIYIDEAFDKRDADVSDNIKLKNLR